jgi:hypothetical protein
MLAGIPVNDLSVLHLTSRLREAGFDDTSERLEDCRRREVKVVALTVPEREDILRSLEECPEELAELRAVLLREHEWRRREGGL